MSVALAQQGGRGGCGREGLACITRGSEPPACGRSVAAATGMSRTRSSPHPPLTYIGQGWRGQKAAGRRAHPATLRPVWFALRLRRRRAAAGARTETEAFREAPICLRAGTCILGLTASIAGAQPPALPQQALVETAICDIGGGGIDPERVLRSSPVTRHRHTTPHTAQPSKIVDAPRGAPRLSKYIKGCIENEYRP